MDLTLLLTFCCALARSTAAAPPAVPAPAVFMAAAPQARNWRNDAGHVLTLTVATPAVYGLAIELGATRKQARIVTAGTMLAAMVLKEWHDHRAVGNFSGRDIGFGVIGMGAGFYIAERISWNPPGAAEKD